MPNIPRLNVVNTKIRFAPLRLPFKKVCREMNRSEQVLRRMGITPEGIEVDTLRTYLAGRKKPLKNFPLRTLNYQDGKFVKPEFREESLRAILGRFGKDTLFPRYGEWQDLAKTLLKAFAEGNFSTFLWDLSYRIFHPLDNPSYANFLPQLDFSGLGPDFEKMKAFFVKEAMKITGFDMNLRCKEIEREVKKVTDYFLNKCALAGMAGDVTRLFQAVLGCYVAILGCYTGNSDMVFEALERLSKSDRNLYTQYFREPVFACSLSPFYKLRLALLSKDIKLVLEIIDSAHDQLDSYDIAYICSQIYYDQKDFLVASYGIKVPPHHFLPGLSNFSLLPFVKNYDAVIPVARGGLCWVAHLVAVAGIPMLVADAHDHSGENIFRWLSPVNPDRLTGKRILVLEDGIESGNTLTLVFKEIEKYHPDKVDLVFTQHHPLGQFVQVPIASSLKKVFFLDEFEPAEAKRSLHLFACRQWAYVEEKKDGKCLRDSIKALEAELKQKLEEISTSKCMSEIQIDQLKRAFYKKLFEIVVSPLELPSVLQAAREQVERLGLFLKELNEKARLGFHFDDLNGALVARRLHDYGLVTKQAQKILTQASPSAVISLGQYLEPWITPMPPTKENRTEQIEKIAHPLGLVFVKGNQVLLTTARESQLLKWATEIETWDEYLENRTILHESGHYCLRTGFREKAINSIKELAASEDINFIPFFRNIIETRDQVEEKITKETKESYHSEIALGAVDFDHWMVTNKYYEVVEESLKKLEAIAYKEESKRD